MSQDKNAPEWVQKADVWMDGASDRLSPLLLRNLRQSVRSRAFIGVFAIMLFFAILFSGMGYLQQDPESATRRLGRYYFSYLYAILNIAVFVCVPALLGNTLRQEKLLKLDENLIISSLTPQQIIRGHLATGLMMIFLIYAALTPFIMYTYLLRGVDQLTIAFGLVLSLFIGLMICMFTITAINVVNDDRVKTAITVLIVLSSLGTSFWMMALIMEGGFWITRAMARTEFWVMAGFMATLYITQWMILYQLAVSSVKEEQTNRSTGVRVAFLIQFLALLAWLIPTLLFKFSRRVYPPVDVFLVLFLIHWAVAALVFCPEKDQLTRRQKADISKLHPLLYPLAPILMPGGARGFLFVGIGLVINVCFIPFCTWKGTGAMVLVSSAYLIGYISLPSLIFKSVAPHKYKPKTCRVLTVIGICFVLIFSLILAGVLGRFSNHPVLVVNPIWAISMMTSWSPRHQELIILFSCVLFIGSLIAYLPHVSRSVDETWKLMRQGRKKKAEGGDGGGSDAPKAEVSEAPAAEPVATDKPAEEAKAETAGEAKPAEEAKAETAGEDKPVEEAKAETAGEAKPAEEAKAETAGEDKPVEEAKAETAGEDKPVEEAKAEPEASVEDGDDSSKEK